MNNHIQTHNELVRLADHEPLVLIVSPLSDFLWDDFVRDTSPRVNYLMDRYDIRQLSRFGKELFEHLYQGEDVTTLVSLEDAELYFREKQNGGNPSFPKGYKPENAFWTGLMNDIVNSPAWSFLEQRCVGDQFASGNNAVVILNKLSEIIEVQIEEKQIDAEAIANGGDKLKEIREQYVEAKKAGDDAKAAELRKQGKALAQQLEQQLQDAREKMSPQISRAMDKAQKETENLDEAMENLAGDAPGQGRHSQDLAEKQSLARKLRQNKKLMELARRLGALRRAWNNRKRARMSHANYSGIVGARFSDAVTQAFPAELALAATDQGRALFALKYSQKTILTKDYEAPTKNLDRGPIIIYVDVSGSMNGESELWSKAIAFVVTEEAIKQKREVEIVLFDSYIQDSFKIKPDSNNRQELLNFVLTWTTHGGTSFVTVINHLLNKTDLDKKADVLMITDGHANVPDAYVQRLKRFKNEVNLDWNTFCIGKASTTVESFSDSVHTVDTNDDPKSSDLFQNVLM